MSVSKESSLVLSTPSFIRSLSVSASRGSVSVTLDAVGEAVAVAVAAEGQGRHGLGDYEGQRDHEDGDQAPYVLPYFESEPHTYLLLVVKRLCFGFRCKDNINEPRVPAHPPGRHLVYARWPFLAACRLSPFGAVG